MIALILVGVLYHNPVEGWAVLLEMNDFPGGYADLPINFINTERMQDMLVYHGWEKDNMWVKKDNITKVTVEEGIEYLKSHADANDVVVFYITAHGGYLEYTLEWNSTFPQLWNEIRTERKLLIVDSCFAGSYIPEGDNFIGIGSVSETESAWVGLPEEGLPIIGCVFTYYFCESMKDRISVEEGFSECVVKVKEYMGEVVYPSFKEVYPPENFDMYDPDPVLVDGYPGSFYLDLENETPLSGILVVVGMLLLMGRSRDL